MTNDEVTVTAELEDDGRIWLWSGYRYKDLLAGVPGSKYGLGKRMQWSLPLSWAACVQLRGVLGANLAVGPRLNEWAGQEFERRVRVCTELRDVVEPPEWLEVHTPYDSGLQLLPFQRVGAWWLGRAQGAVLADEMGTGKTVQAASALNDLDFNGRDPFPCLIVAPKSVKLGWAEELAKWCPQATVAVPKSGKVALEKAIAEGPDVLIVNYEAARTQSRLSGYGSIALTDSEKREGPLNEVEWRTVILDEAHRVKNPQAKQTRACWWLGKRAAYRWCLTGTPVANAPDDLWALLHFTAPDEFPSSVEYKERYCLMAWNAVGGMDVIGVRPDTREEFFKIVDPRLRRVPKAIVLPQLPPKVREVRWCEMSPKQAKAYKEMDESLLVKLAEGEYTAATLPIVQRTRLIQFSSAYATLVPGKTEDKPDVRLSEPSSKLDAMMEYLDDLGDEPCVLFAQSRQLIDLAEARLEKHKVSCVKLVGGMQESERQGVMQAFQAGMVRVFLGTIGAAGEGVTLTRARHLGFLQRADSMIGNKQAEDRIHRIGSEVHESVVITDFVAPGTVEVEQVELIKRKLVRLEEIVRDRPALEKAAREGNESAWRRLQEMNDEESRLMTEDAA